MGGEIAQRGCVTNVERKVTRIKIVINEGLSAEISNEMNKICYDFSDRLPENPKRPQRTHTEKHYIITADNQ